MQSQGLLLCRADSTERAAPLVREEVRRMGSTFCPSRSSRADLDWTVLHAGKNAPIRAAGGHDVRLSSDSSGTGLGLATSLEEVGPVTGTDAGTENGQAEQPEGRGTSDATAETSAERTARFER